MQAFQTDLCMPQFCLRKLKDGGEPGKQIGKISFIDLAGSERGAGQQITWLCACKPENL